ncbi:MAG TPA: sugar transferase [Chloroflexota bacterium]|nr:sugar transferase [Chloroflexota bacterium]
MAQAREQMTRSAHVDVATMVVTPALESKSAQSGYKRPFDIILGSAMLVASAPIFGLVALLVRLTSRGPIFFRQERIGINGRPFTVIKFRTMEADADPASHREYFKRYLQGESAPGEARNVFKLRRDPRITPLGGILRRLGLDELPQLLNVLAGDMSLVGPRPPLEYEVAHYTPHHMGRLAVKPGITGLWQVRGRDAVDFDSMIDMDLEYVDTMSLWLDCKILIVTVPSLVWAFVSH